MEMDWYNVDKVKDFVFELLLENKQMEKELDQVKRSEQYWSKAYLDASNKLKAMEEAACAERMA